MASRITSWVACLLASLPVVIAIGQEASAPTDRPFAIDASEIDRFQAAIEPFVRMGRDTFRGAKERYLNGLPPGQEFFVTADLIDSADRMEQVFVLVVSIDAATIRGRIASEILFMSDYAQGDDVHFPESRAKDWTIVGPDGSEEGNFVGRFLDHYRPGRLFVAVFGFTVSTSGVAEEINVALVTDDRGQRVDIDLPVSWIEMAKELIRTNQTRPTSNEVYVPLIYDPDRPDEPVVVE